MNHFPSWTTTAEYWFFIRQSSSKRLSEIPRVSRDWQRITTANYDNDRHLNTEQAQQQNAARFPGSTVAPRRGALLPPNPGDESPGYGRKPLTRQRELPPSAQAEQRRAAEQQHVLAGSGVVRGKKETPLSS